MARTSAWRNVALATLVAAAPFACTEQVTAPGRCPSLCPADTLQIVDTVITGVVFGDTSVRGYTTTRQLPILVAADEDSFQARAVIRFVQMPKRWFPNVNDTTGVLIGPVDSVTLDLQMDSRDTAAHNVRLLIYRLPGDSLDSTTTFASVQPYFTAGNLLDSVRVPEDTVVAGLHRCWKPVADNLCAALSSIAPLLPDTAIADTLTPGIGLSVRADSQTAVVLGAAESGAGAHLKYYMHCGSSCAPPNDTIHQVFDLTPFGDTYVASPDPAPIPPQTIVIGNQPASRAIMQFQIPRYYVDSVAVSRATLLLMPLRPAAGFKGAVIALEAIPVLRLFGGKSLLIQDTTLMGRGAVTVGSADTVRVEVSAILRAWRGTNPDSLPRAIAIRTANESIETGELVAAGSGGGAQAPRLQISFVRSLKFGVP